jgi:hypothetical protein
MINFYLKILIFSFIAVSLNAQTIDTLKYYYPYYPDSLNTLAFVEICGTPGYCEPVAVWFTPDSSVSDSSYKFYSIKTIRFCFAGNIYEDTTFTIHLSDSIPDDNNLIYKRYISVDVSETNQNFVNDGIYKFKDFDVSGVAQLRNIDIETPFWVVLQNKVWALWNTTHEQLKYTPSYHSYHHGLPYDEWVRLPGDWIVEAIVEYHQVLDLENTSDNILFPKEAFLFQNFPNPFNSSTKIQYQIDQPGDVEILLYSIDGKIVDKIVDEYEQPGKKIILWDASYLSSGVYYYVLVHNGKLIQSRRSLLIK